MNSILLTVNSPSWKLVSRLWNHFGSKRKFQCGLVFLLMIFASFAEVVSIGVVLPFLSVLTAPDNIFRHAVAQPFIQALNLTEASQLLLPVTVIFSIASLLSGILRITLLWAQTRLSFAIGADLSFSIYLRTLYQPYSVHAARNSSELISGIANKANSIVYATLLPIAIVVSSLMMMVSILVILFAIDPVIAISTFMSLGFIYLVIILSIRNILMRDGKRMNYEQNQVFKALQEGLGGIRDILVDGTQKVHAQIFRKADLPLRRATSNIAILAALPRYAVEASGMVLIGAVAYFLAISPAGIEGAIPVLGALALGAQRLLPMLQQTYASWASLRASRANLADVLMLLDQPLPAHAGDEILSSPLPFNKSITLNTLAFKYTRDTPWVLSPGLNLCIHKGSRIGFIGATGSGKSTVLDIIMGLLHPTIGSLVIDGVNIDEHNQRGWQSHIAHVPQAIFLADVSIAENIAFGVPLEDIDHDRVREAAQKAQIAQAIESWSKQYSTVVGERGVRMSGGQRQRIGIARALYKKADVIVLDEATSALDNDTESSVMAAIESLEDDLTVIIVAHRLSTLKNCSQIVELCDGQIKRIGSYVDIVEQ